MSYYARNHQESYVEVSNTALASQYELCVLGRCYLSCMVAVNKGLLADALHDHNLGRHGVIDLVPAQLCHSAAWSVQTIIRISPLSRHTSCKQLSLQ